MRKLKSIDQLVFDPRGVKVIGNIVMESFDAWYVESPVTQDVIYRVPKEKAEVFHVDYAPSGYRANFYASDAQRCTRAVLDES